MVDDSWERLCNVSLVYRTRNVVRVAYLAMTYAMIAYSQSYFLANTLVA
jgi:hypothetical protein